MYYCTYTLFSFFFLFIAVILKILIVKERAVITTITIVTTTIPSIVIEEEVTTTHKDMEEATEGPRTLILEVTTMVLEDLCIPVEAHYLTIKCLTERDLIGIPLKGKEVAIEETAGWLVGIIRMIEVVRIPIGLIEIRDKRGSRIKNCFLF